jgi:hypothetical protein
MRIAFIIFVIAVLCVLGQAVRSPSNTSTAAPSTPPEMSISDVKTRATTVPYERLARDPGKYQGAIVVLEGKVIQSLENGQNLTLRVNVAADDWQHNFQGDIVYVDYRKNRPDEARILEGDKVRFWGKYVGILSYKAVLGQTIQIPHVVARIVEDQGRYVAPPFRVEGRK